ncbi:hypothetical protein QVD17_30913 [Tagetes erecta]|uniref:F-box domain-containing protein n=1 Tax=Tagetes erecta TaxID=13708 RepID=A0AAD8NNQ6_TARER|nr:hypothetical protein QVD17_30913 [Tagetes erecta]
MSTEIEGKKKRELKVSLPLSLIESEILPRLPAKSIGVCRRVCKQWKSFLSSPTFCRMHLSYHATIDDYKLLLFDGVTLGTLPLSGTIPCNLPDLSLKVILLASLDGLVCLVSCNQLLFWNPLTGSYRKLSSIDPDDDDDDLHYFHSSSDVFGFYKDESCNDYRLLYLKREGDQGAYIYSHVLDTWRPLNFSFDFKAKDEDEHTFYSWSPATFWGQCLYFTVTAYFTKSMDKDSWIICFDVKTETFRKIQFPGVPDAGGSRGFCGMLVVLNGSLHLCVTYDDVDCLRHGDLWRMNGGDDDGWVKVAANFSDQGYGWQYISTVTVGNSVAVFDPEQNSFEKLNPEDFVRRYRYFCSNDEFQNRYFRMIYVETLVSPNL